MAAQSFELTEWCAKHSCPLQPFFKTAKLCKYLGVGMMDTAVHLLKTRRFLPLFITLFLGAINDNLFKMAMVTVITYELAAKMGLNAGILNPLAAGIFILPFALFSAFAGQLADKYEKSRQIRIIKLVEIFIMLLGSAALYFSSINLMFIMALN